jgi:tetratricopeptide (TPR) repeat protein
MAIEKKPDYITAWNKLGKIMEQKITDKDPPEKKDKYLKLSKKFFDKSLAIDPFNFQGRLGIATYYFKLKEHRKCDLELNKITLPQEANDIRCLKLKADNYYAMEDFAQALDIYLKCKNVESSFKDEVQMSIGNCYYTMDDYENAKLTFLELQKRQPKNIEIKIQLAACHMMQKKVGEAVNVFKECIELDRTRWELYLYLAKVHMHSNDFEEAAKCIRNYNSMNKDDITGHLKLAEMYEVLGAHQSALEELEVSFREPDRKNQIKGGS